MIVVGVLVIYAGVVLIDAAEPGEYAIAALGGLVIACGVNLIWVAGRRSVR